MQANESSSFVLSSFVLTSMHAGNEVYADTKMASDFLCTVNNYQLYDAVHRLENVLHICVKKDIFAKKCIAVKP